MMYKVNMSVEGRIVQMIEAKSADEARIKAKRRYEEMPIRADDKSKIVGELYYGDVDDFRIEVAE